MYLLFLRKFNVNVIKTEQPSMGFIYASDAPPPYPGLDSHQGASTGHQNPQYPSNINPAQNSERGFPHHHQLHSLHESGTGGQEGVSQQDGSSLPQPSAPPLESDWQENKRGC